MPRVNTVTRKEDRDSFGGSDYITQKLGSCVRGDFCDFCVLLSLLSLLLILLLR
jgi:hypothetical protein